MKSIVYFSSPDRTPSDIDNDKIKILKRIDARNIFAIINIKMGMILHDFYINDSSSMDCIFV